MADELGNLAGKATKALAESGEMALYIAAGYVVGALLSPFIVRFFPQLAGYAWVASVILGVVLFIMGSGSAVMRNVGIGLAVYGLLQVLIPVANSVVGSVAGAISK